MGPHTPYLLHDGYNFYPDYHGKLGKKVLVAEAEKNTLSEDDMKYAVSLYDSSIAYTDQSIGNLLACLKKMNLYNDTLIVLLSDHGEEFGEHGMTGHGKHLYDEALSVPLIIKLPGQQKGGYVRGVLSLLDLFPSVMDALHLDSSHFGLQGITRHLDKLRSLRDTDIYSSTDFGREKSRSIGRQPYKLIIGDSGQELYDLQNDSGERRNLLKAEPSVAVALQQSLKAKEKEIDDGLAGMSYEAYVGVSDSVKKNLQSLGYLQ
jgi:arylsulfatase A-like enzyme